MTYEIPDSVCIIDLETLPADATVGMDLTRPPGWEDPPLVVEDPKRRTVPASYKKESTIQDWWVKERLRFKAALEDAQVAAVEAQAAAKAKATETWKRGSVDGYRARIACISLAFGEGDVVVIDCVDNEEAGLRQLGQITSGLDRPAVRTWVAHNGEGFDFPMLQIRALKYKGYNLAHRLHQEKTWDGRLVDTLKWWPTLGGWGDRFKGTKLDDICAHLGIERSDNPIDGSQVLDAYVRGDWDQVIAHAKADVRDLREVYRVLAEVRGV